MRRALYIVLVLVMAAACGPHRIPRDDMEDILYRMLVQDQQIKQNPQLRRQADTMLVYEGIFQAYGFNTDDFLYSLEYVQPNGEPFPTGMSLSGGVKDFDTWPVVETEDMISANQFPEKIGLMINGDEASIVILELKK